MNAEKIQKLAIQIALEQPETVLSHPFGPQCSVIKVFDKMFLLTGELKQQKFINLKIKPEQADELKELGAVLDKIQISVQNRKVFSCCFGLP